MNKKIITLFSSEREKDKLQAKASNLSLRKSNKNILRILAFVALLTSPIIALAFPGEPGVIVNLVPAIDRIVGFIWTIFVAFAVVMFLVAGFMFLTARGEPGKLQSARSAVLWGVIGVVVGLLAFSITVIVRNTLGV